MSVEKTGENPQFAQAELRQKTPEEQQFDEVIASVRLDAIELLRQHGTKTKLSKGKKVWNLLKNFNAPVGLRRPPLPISDIVTVEGEVDDENGKTVRAQIVSSPLFGDDGYDTANIDLFVEGLNYHLVLGRSGFIQEDIPRRDNSITTEYFVSRTATLEESHEWQNVINALKIQFPIHQGESVT